MKFEWRFLFVAGMWFQDLFNYDFRRTEMCIIPYGTQMGEISFCAYNTGVGFRQIIEKMKKTATVAEWYKTRGRHPVYAKDINATSKDRTEEVYGKKVLIPGQTPRGTAEGYYGGALFCWRVGAVGASATRA